MSQQPTLPLRIGTRGSPLALIQTNMFIDTLRASFDWARDSDAVQIITLKASGDHDPLKEGEQHLRDRGGKGLFTKELEEALLAGTIDVAVHSMKDMPTWMPEKLAIAAVLPRADVRDAFISNVAKDIAGLPQGASVGTSSLRRQSQLLALRPDLKIMPFRGNVDTRIKKLEAGQVQATILAAAGLLRMGFAQKITAFIEPEHMLPSPAQGVIGLETRRADDALNAMLSKINCATTFAMMTAERAMLEVLDGSCNTPIGGLAAAQDGRLHLRGLVASENGTGIWRAEGHGVDAVALGREVGRMLRVAVPPGILPS